MSELGRVHPHPPLPPPRPPRAIGKFRSIRRRSTKQCGFQTKIDFAKRRLFRKGGGIF
jgi:hypothetical protein